MESPSDHGGSDVDWESRYRAGDTPWDRGEAHPAFQWWLEGNPLAGKILVPGCGLGHDVRALAVYDAEIIGMDLSETAVVAARNIQPTGSEKYVLGDFFRPPGEWEGTFDAIFEHTCFCAIDPKSRADYVQSAASMLKSGGTLLAIFFLDPGVDEGPPHGCTTEELDALFGNDFAVISEERALPTYAGREGREMLRLLRKKT